VQRAEQRRVGAVAERRIAIAITLNARWVTSDRKA
jgi:hypothetical protein